MKCPFCNQVDTKVIDSRLNQQGDVTRRRRECPKCQGRFTTYEHLEQIMPVVVKKDGRREDFNRSKILDGILKACQKRSIPRQKIDETVALIEKRIQAVGLKEIPARTVGQMVMASLRELDKVAYVRFASVYREFRDVEEFVAELQGLPAGQDEQGEGQSLAFPFAIENSPPTKAKASESKGKA